MADLYGRVHQFYSVLARGEYDDLMEMLEDDATWTDHEGRRLVGRQQIREHLKKNKVPATRIDRVEVDGTKATAHIKLHPTAFRALVSEGRFAFSGDRVKSYAVSVVRKQ